MQSQHENKLHLLYSVLSFLEKVERPTFRHFVLGRYATEREVYTDAIDSIKCVIQDLEAEDE